MELDIYQVDAFAERVFEGNPAVVVPLDKWIQDDVLQKIAMENNLSETAFFVPEGDGYRLRWFTPAAEVDLCGHATLAAAHVLFAHLGVSVLEIRFQTKSGALIVRKSGDAMSMDFPGSLPEDSDPPEALLKGLGISPQAVLAAFDYVVRLETEEEVAGLTPDFREWRSIDRRGVVVTAPGRDLDFVSRCFFPQLDVDEDPVTGSAHCELAPYWAKVLGKNRLTARQLSARSGRMECEVREGRVILWGKARDYMKGRISIGD